MGLRREAPVLGSGEPLRQSPHIVSVIDGNATVLMDVARGAYYSLDEVGGRIWQLIAEERTVAAVIEELLSEYDAPEDVVTGDVLRLMRELGAARLIVVS